MKGDAAEGTKGWIAEPGSILGSIRDLSSSEQPSLKVK